MRATAAVLRDAQARFELEDVELSDPRRDEVLVSIVGCGVCHSDLLARTMPAGAIQLPMIFGHEGSGVVEAVGPAVKEVAVGDHVVLSFDSCGACRQCLQSRQAYCERFVPLNLDGAYADGGSSAVDRTGDVLANRWFGQSSFATHAIASARCVVRVDPSLPLELLGPLGCGIQTGAGTVIRSLGVRPGSKVGVFGAGAVGLSAVMAARLSGSSEVVAVDLHASRRNLALEIGASLAFDGADPELLAQIETATGGLDYVVDTTAVPAVIDTAIRSLAVGGSGALVGVGAGEVSLEPSALMGRSLTYVVEGSSVPQTFIPTLIDLWQRDRFPFDKLIKTYAFDQINKAVEDALRGDTVKPVLLMSG